MTQPKMSRRKPSIVVSEVDYKRLTDLSNGAQSRVPEVGEDLVAELDRAHVVMSGTAPAKVVQMGSTLEFRSDSRQQRRVTLVFPGDADIAEDRISVLTPISAALIRLSTGQSITWTARYGRKHELTIVDVEQPDSPLISSIMNREGLYCDCSTGVWVARPAYLHHAQ